MARSTPLKSILSRAGLPAVAIIFMGFFAYSAVLGPNGVLVYGDYKRQLASKQAELAKLEEQRAQLRNRVALLDQRGADPDMVDELTRKKLNVVHPDEVIVPLN
ncbi:MAG: septum formation initiator [Alphaproteobacteria bacterium HGW-Alphaproteobacteria-16]|nr:MAG: septum formation initiator [Alphaproteobacteria bacterium HGW-Alphaproteobacteria-16]